MFHSDCRINCHQCTIICCRIMLYACTNTGIHRKFLCQLIGLPDFYYLPCKFAGLNNILIEANYRRDILEANIAAGRLPFAVRNRTLKSHFSYDNCVQALQANDLTRVNNIVLIHLSDGNSNAEQFRQGIKEATGGKTVHIAEAGLVINFNKTPF